MPYLINEPSPYETVEVWKEHLKQLEKLDQSAPEVKEAMEHARTILQEKAGAAKR